MHVRMIVPRELRMQCVFPDVELFALPRCSLVHRCNLVVQTIHSKVRSTPCASHSACSPRMGCT